MRSLVTTGHNRGGIHALVPLPLLHGAAGIWDELVVLGLFLGTIGFLAFLSWRAGRDRKRRRAQGRGGSRGRGKGKD
ncbi:MAG: hypothetical protein WD208_09345 [Dehalococcoidia bacterium]